MKTFSRKEAQKGTKRGVSFLRVFARVCGQSVWLLILVFSPVARAIEITLPPETAKLVESPLPGYQLAVASCATCHSMDYVKMQPTSSRAYWKASVTKMQKTFGAPIPEEIVEPIVDYLVKTYGNERSAGAPAGSAQSKAKVTPAKK
jgi:hypothetical protein